MEMHGCYLMGVATYMLPFFKTVTKRDSHALKSSVKMTDFSQLDH